MGSGERKRGRSAASVAFGVGLLAVLVVAGCRPGLRKAPTGPTFFDDPAPLVKVLSGRLSKSTQVCSINVRPRTVVVDYIGTLGTPKAFEFRQGDPRATPREPRRCIAEPVRPLADALFSWSSVDVSLLPKLTAEAAKRIGFASTEKISHALLERPGDVKNSPPLWKIHAKGAQGWASFDLKGKLVAGYDRRANALDEKGPIDYFEDPSAIPKAIESRLGKDFRLVELMIFETYFHLEGRGAADEAKLERYQVLGGQFGAPGKGAWAFREDIDQMLFPLSALDWSLVPKMAVDAKARSGDPTAAVSHVQVAQGIHRKPLTWAVYLHGGAFYVYTAKGEYMKR